MRKIPLTQGQFTLVDDEDYEVLSQFKWCAKWSPDVQGYYVKRNKVVNSKKLVIYMSRWLLNAPKNLQVDHINHNGLDNRRSNLRLATNSQNLYNSRRSKGRSGFRGVTFEKRTGKWEARIKVDRKSINLGTFSDKMQAALAYNHAASALHKEFATLNPI